MLIRVILLLAGVSLFTPTYADTQAVAEAITIPNTEVHRLPAAP